MKNTLLVSGLVVLSLSCVNRAPSPPARPSLRVYTYDSFLGKSGLGNWIRPEFEKLCGCELRLLSIGDGGQIAARLELDQARGKRDADVVLGIDEWTWVQARDHFEPWGDWEPKNFAEITPSARVEKGFLPFDYGVFSLMAETSFFEKKQIPLPQRLADLPQNHYRKKLVLEDPRTSTPGLAFLLFTQEVLGDGADAFWKKLRDHWLAMLPGWDTAYGLFLKGEASLVWSYSSSQAYHRSENQSQYRAVLFEEGNPIHIEGAALLKGISPDTRRLAEQFFEFLLSPEVQTRVFTSQWMYSVIKNTPIPASFAGIPRPSKVIHLRKTRAEVQAALQRFSRIAD